MAGRIAVLIAAAGAVAVGATDLSSASTAATEKLTVSVSGKGTVKSSPRGISCPKACTKAFAKGKTVKLTAKPATGSAFARWKGACASKKPVCVVRLTAAKRVDAVFTLTATPPPATGFTPQTLAGTWTGTWRNQTFGSSGPASIAIKNPDPNSFTFTANFGGNVFGCSQPPPTSGTVTQGEGPNHWNFYGFTIQITTPTGGTVSLTYIHSTGALTGNGTSGCNPGLSWTINGAFTGNTFSGTVSISLSGGGSAVSVVSLTRG